MVVCAAEMDGFSAAQLMQRTASPSKYEVVRDLKALLVGCARPPAWLAAMASELDKLAEGCARRAGRLDRLREARDANTHALFCCECVGCSLFAVKWSLHSIDG